MEKKLALPEPVSSSDYETQLVFGLIDEYAPEMSIEDKHEAARYRVLDEQSNSECIDIMDDIVGSELLADVCGRSEKYSVDCEGGSQVESGQGCAVDKSQQYGERSLGRCWQEG